MISSPHFEELKGQGNPSTTELAVSAGGEVQPPLHLPRRFRFKAFRGLARIQQVCNPAGFHYCVLTFGLCVLTCLCPRTRPKVATCSPLSQVCFAPEELVDAAGGRAAGTVHPVFRPSARANFAWRSSNVQNWSAFNSRAQATCRVSSVGLPGRAA